MRFLFLMFVPFWTLEAASQGQVETDFGADLIVLTGVFDDSDTEIDAEPVLMELSLTGDAEYLFDNGVEVSGHLTFRAQTDHPARSGFAGALLDCPPSDSNCRNIEGQGVRGAFSRLSSTGVRDEDQDIQGSLELAYVMIDGSWGELVVGRDQGVAQRFYEGGPTVFNAGRGTNPILDPMGIAISRTRNDISSTAEKVSYVTPRLLGVRAGVSVTPDASVERLDLDTHTATVGVLEPEIEGVVEAGLQASRHLRDADLRLRGSLTWSNTNLTSPAAYEDMNTFSVGVDVERRDEFRLGASLLTSDNGGQGDYQSAAIGGSYIYDAYELKLSADSTKDDTINLDGWGVSVGAGRQINDHLELTLGYKASEVTVPEAETSTRRSIFKQGVLLEISIRN